MAIRLSNFKEGNIPQIAKLGGGILETLITSVQKLDYVIVLIKQETLEVKIFYLSAEIFLSSLLRRSDGVPTLSLRIETWLTVRDPAKKEPTPDGCGLEINPN